MSLASKELGTEMKKLNTKYKIQNTKYRFRGVAALITVLTLGGIIFIVSLTTSLLAFWQGQNADSIRRSDQAYYAAYSGLQDALIHLERNKDFSNAGYNLSVNGTDDVSIVVSNTGSSATITTTATERNAEKKLQTVTDIDTTTGLITPISTTELTL